MIRLTETVLGTEFNTTSLMIRLTDTVLGTEFNTTSLMIRLTDTVLGTEFNTCWSSSSSSLTVQVIVLSTLECKCSQDLLRSRTFPMSNKSGHDLEPTTHKHHHGDHGKHPHGDHGKHYHGDHGKHPHGDHGEQPQHKDSHGHKHPALRDAVMKAGKGDGANTHGHAGGHSPAHARPRAGTLTRRDTGKHHKGHDHDKQSVGKHSEGHATISVEYENTYKMVPDSRFQETQVREIIAKVLKENLTDPQYDPRVMSRRCLELSDIIKERVKQLDMHRFKIVCMVTIGQNTDQSMMVSSRCLWNFNFDNFTSFTLKKEPYYAIGMVFATYAE
ncbi:uncharacterized protein LOC143294572 [Babylonia areolata]|uniref:uncharacterized protein LOC143294572 n=1 Tax=Babylonia areolata TaxID=304850 RepID=UPI003FD65DDE